MFRVTIWVSFGPTKNLLFNLKVMLGAEIILYRRDN